MRIGRALATVVLAASVFTACSDDDDPVETDQPTTTVLAPTTSAELSPIILSDFTFSGLEVKAGTKVLVQNRGQQTHTFSADDRTFDTGQVAPGRNVELTVPSRTGTYEVKCNNHPDRMTGELKVT